MKIKTTNEIVEEEYQSRPDKSSMYPSEFEWFKKVNDKFNDRKWIAIEDLIKCIDDTYKDLDMGKTIPIFIQRLKERITPKKKGEK